MKIVEAKYQPSKRAKMRETIALIVGQSDKAALIDSDSEFREFCRLARKQGCKPKSQKLKTGGWKVWVS